MRFWAVAGLWLFACLGGGGAWAIEGERPDCPQIVVAVSQRSPTPRRASRTLRVLQVSTVGSVVLAAGGLVGASYYFNQKEVPAKPAEPEVQPAKPAVAAVPIVDQQADLETRRSLDLDAQALKLLGRWDPAPTAAAPTAPASTQSSAAPSESTPAAPDTSGEVAGLKFLYYEIPTFDPAKEAAAKGTTVVFDLIVEADGRISSAELKSSCGDSVLDQAVLEASKKCLFLPPGKTTRVEKLQHTFN